MPTPNSTPGTYADQDSPTFLVNTDYAALCRWLNCCPAADTITAYSLTLERFVVLQTRCRRWGCPHCGPRKIAHLTHKVTAAKPSKFVTLTVNNGLFKCPREAYDRTRRAVGALTRSIRSDFGEWEYLRILEITRKGWPHYHFLARGAYVPQSWLANRWDELTGAHIVDIRKVKNLAHAAHYLMKYLYKQKAVPWTTRRVCWSRGFFAPPADEPPPKLELIDANREGMPPSSYFANYHDGRTLERVGPDMWIVTTASDTERLRAARTEPR